MGTHTPRPPKAAAPTTAAYPPAAGFRCSGWGWGEDKKGKRRWGMQQGDRLSGGGCLRLGETPQTWGDSVRASTVCAQEAAVDVGLRRGNSSQLYFPFRGEKR